MYNVCNDDYSVRLTVTFIVSGEYHKIDNIAYPKNTNLSKSFLKNMKEHAIGILSTLSGGLFGGKDKDNKDEIPESFKPLNHQEMSIYSLECYLSRYKDMLCNGSFSGFDIHTIALDISFIYNSLCAEHVSSIGDPINRVQAQEKKVDRLAIKGVSMYHTYIQSIIACFHNCLTFYFAETTIVV